MKKCSYARLVRPRAPRVYEIADERLNYGDYCDLPEDGHRYEIIGGELFNSPPRSDVAIRLRPRCFRGSR